jgi:hypothetical protein
LTEVSYNAASYGFPPNQTSDTSGSGGVSGNLLQSSFDK